MHLGGGNFILEFRIITVSLRRDKYSGYTKKSSIKEESSLYSIVFVVG